MAHYSLPWKLTPTIARNIERNNLKKTAAYFHKANSNQSPNPGVPSSQASSTTDRTRTQRKNDARRKKVSQFQQNKQRRWIGPQKVGNARPNVAIEPFELFALGSGGVGTTSELTLVGSPTADPTGSPSALGLGGFGTIIGSPASVERTATTTSKLMPAATTATGTNRSACNHDEDSEESAPKRSHTGLLWMENNI